MSKRKRKPDPQQERKAGQVAATRELIWGTGDGVLPAPYFQERAAAAVHQAVVECTGTSGKGFCALYAFAGSVVLSMYAPTSSYVYQCGTAQVQATEDGLCLSMDAKQGGPLEYHSWVARIHHLGSGEPRTVRGGEMITADPDTRIELVDFAARFYRQHAEDNGLTWDLPEPSAFIWGWADELVKQGVRLIPDPARMGMVKEMVWGVPAHEALMKQTCRRALSILKAA